MANSRGLSFCASALLLVGGACAGDTGSKPAAPAEAGAGEPPTERPAYALALHGGAGVIERGRMTPEYEAEVRAALARALDLGAGVLGEGGAAEDAVVAVVGLLEDMPHFNAGKGAVYTYEGTNELDASLMRGRDLQAGAVSGVTGVRHPIALAREVMLNSDHVMLSGPGAEAFADERGVERAGPEWFRTERRYESWRRARERADAEPRLSEDGKFGTVGCVALDREGHLAAGTSTGGMTLKRYGRIGDSPVIGAGTYADDRACAVSATGHGEYFLRYAVAHDIAARMLHGGASLAEAADAVVGGELVRAGGEGGVVAVDAAGNVAMPFNSAGMYRAYATPAARAVAIYGDEEPLVVE